MVWEKIFAPSVQFSRSVVSNSLRPHEPQHSRPNCPSPTPGVYSNSCLVISSIQFSSVAQLYPTLWPCGLQHTRLSYLSPTPRVYSKSCPLSRWCHPAISSSVVLFSCLQYFWAPGSFPRSQFFILGGQVIVTSPLAWVLPINIQDWFPLPLTCLISLHFKSLSRVFNTTVQKNQFFGTQPSLQSNSHIHTWLLEKP